MDEKAIRNDSEEEEGPDEMIAAYRHDAHKLNGRTHENAPDTFHGVAVNQTVPHGADGDAAMLSRPRGEPEQTVESHATIYRLSLLNGESRYDPEEFSRPRLSEAIKQLLTGSDPEAMHQAWLTSKLASGFNESIYYPYTSLKYHTLLVAALLINYHDGHEFCDLDLIVDNAGEIVSHRTIYAGDRFALRIDKSEGEGTCARLGNSPGQSWASTWSRLTGNPLDVNHDKHDMVLDANLRRIWSWSTALQYIEDYETHSENP